MYVLVFGGRKSDVAEGRMINNSKVMVTGALEYGGTVQINRKSSRRNIHL